jgi:hypothetical protein
VGGQEHADAMALQGLAWLLQDPALRAAFLDDSGLTPGDLKNALTSRSFLAAVMDFLLADEARVLAFCAAQGLSADAPLRARAQLPGGDLPHWT